MLLLLFVGGSSKKPLVQPVASGTEIPVRNVAQGGGVDAVAQASCVFRPSFCWTASSEAGRLSRVNLLAMAHRTGLRLAEVGFLLIVFAGVWLAAAQLPMFKSHTTARTIVAGVALKLSGACCLLSLRTGVTSVSNSARTCYWICERSMGSNPSVNEVKSSCLLRSSSAIKSDCRAEYCFQPMWDDAVGSSKISQATRTGAPETMARFSASLGRVSTSASPAGPSTTTTAKNVDSTRRLMRTYATREPAAARRLSDI